MARCDLTIRGAGILGLSVAWACTLRGARVRIIDPYGPGAGSSGGLVGALAPHVPENWNTKKAFQLDSLLLAETFWSDVDRTSGLSSGYTRSGRLQPIADTDALALARARAGSAKELWPDTVFWRVVPAAENAWGLCSPTGQLVQDTLSGLLHPRRAVASLVAALKARRAEFCQNHTDEGMVIWATGIAGLKALSATHHRAVGTGVKGQAALFAADCRGAPQLFMDGMHVIPHADGTVAVGSTSETQYDAPDRTDHALDALIDKARAQVSALSKAPVIEKWAGVRPRARSRAPMLGHWPDKPGHYIANGGFKIGFGMAPKIAKVMAALVLDDIDAIPEGFEVAASF